MYYLGTSRAAAQVGAGGICLDAKPCVSRLQKLGPCGTSQCGSTALHPNVSLGASLKRHIPRPCPQTAKSESLDVESRNFQFYPEFPRPLMYSPGGEHWRGALLLAVPLHPRTMNPVSQGLGSPSRGGSPADGEGRPLRCRRGLRSIRLPVHPLRTGSAAETARPRSPSKY